MADSYLGCLSSDGSNPKHGELAIEDVLGYIPSFGEHFLLCDLIVALNRNERSNSFNSNPPYLAGS